MFTVVFWRAAGERAVRSFAGSVLSTWVVAGQVFDVRGVDWGLVLGVGGGAAAVSLLLSLVATKVGSSESPSFVADPAAADKPPAV